jgi:hypothetical protein
MARETIRELHGRRGAGDAEQQGTSVSERAAGHAENAAMPTAAATGGEEEIDLCLVLLERRLHAADTRADASAEGASNPLIHSERGARGGANAAKHKSNRGLPGDARAGSAPLSRRAGETPSDALGAKLSELSSSAAQSPPGKRAGGRQVQPQKQVQVQKQVQQQQRRKTTATFEGRLSRTSQAHESRAATVFQEQLAAAAQMERHRPALEAAQRALMPKGDGLVQRPKPSERGGDDPSQGTPLESSSSPPQSPLPLTRDQIKTQCLERAHAPKQGPPDVVLVPGSGTTLVRAKSAPTAAAVLARARTILSRPSIAAAGRGKYGAAR